MTTAHEGVTAQASRLKINATTTGVCALTLEVDAVSGGTITGSFTATAAPVGGAAGDDIVITEGVFEITDPIN